VRGNVALLQVSPPGEDGLCCLGISVDHSLEAIGGAGLIIAEVNERVPRVPGAAFLPVVAIDCFVPSSRRPIELPAPPIGIVEAAIGRHVAALVPDGATVQVGVGAIGEAVIRALAGKRDLGIHSGLIPDGVVDLVEAGVVNGRYKRIDRGKIVTAGLVGTARLYDWARENPMVELRPTSYTHHPAILRQLDNFVAMNAALEVDLLGRVNAETVAGVQLGGVGGQVDFLRGAAQARGGRSFIILSATTPNGKVSRIVPRLRWSAGAVLTTPPEDVHYIITEYGAAELRGKTARERAEALIEIAHPDFREGLREAAESGVVP
jgi:4-hydroxybutyrate CoA-transferase